ncbi:MAG: hypothetical protein U0V74_10855 [Chitinophagales bacterium]
MKYLPLFLTFLLTTKIYAQSDVQEVVYLKNGSIIKGKITEQSADKLKIELSGGSLFVFTTAEIDSLKKENVLKEKIKAIKKDYFRRNRGYRNMTELGVIYGPPQKDNPNIYYGSSGDDFGLSLHTVNGYQFWPYLYIGGGVGIDRYVNYKQTFSPLYVRLATEFLKMKVTPYVFADGGYSVMWKQKLQEGYSYNKNIGGYYFSAGGGLRIYTRGRASVILSLAYKRHYSESSWAYAYEGSPAYNINRTYQRAVLSIGVTF